MKYLTLELIKAHARLDCDCEDDLIDLYGCAAEDTVLNELNRSLEDLKAANGGEVPFPVVQATLLLAAQSIGMREPSTPTNLSVIPYNFDVLIKPYMKL